MDALAALLPPFLRRRKRSAAEEEEAQLRAALMACSRAAAADKFLEQRAENVQLRADKVQLRDANGALTQRVAELERAGARGDAVAAAAREAVRDELAARPAKAPRCVAPSGHEDGAAGGGEETGHDARPEEDASDACIDDVLGTVALLCSENAYVRAAARARLLALTHCHDTEVQAAPQPRAVPLLTLSLRATLAAAGADGATVQRALIALSLEQRRLEGSAAMPLSMGCVDCAACTAARQNGAMCALRGCGRRDQAAGAHARMSTCGRCRIAAYCCVEHQRADWARHKATDCQKLKRAVNK
jgi:hypothetical protein